ncbi:hypothetical protein N0V82_009457 [Gnomoniopsis sp. IMI 355080]|nr:hypothetical protein N0V82_009457 [Gnomoniopsis sp. IMI 355080]
MATFNDLAIELQEIIWMLVLPTRGIHWVDVEGIPHEPAFIRESISMTEWHQFERIPETFEDAWDIRQDHPGYHDRATAKYAKGDFSGAFFRRLFTTVPTVFGRDGLGGGNACDTTPGGHGQLTSDVADEIACTRRCRKLSTYTQIATLLSTCRLSRLVAQQRIRDDRKSSWPLYRSLGPHYRPRPLDVWKDQYSDNAKIPRLLLSPGDDEDDVDNGQEMQRLVPRIHALDLVIFRLHDRRGRPTTLLRHAAWQYGIEALRSYDTLFACFDRVGIEWHPSFATSRHHKEEHSLRAGNVQAVVRLMNGAHSASFPCWLVDGVPRPDWQRHYPAVVQEIFAARMARTKDQSLRHLDRHWPLLSDEEKTAMLADQHLGQEYEANGRRYYIVFVVIRDFSQEERRLLRKAKLGHIGPFPGSAELWPKALRESIRVAQDVMKESSNLGTWSSISPILSWEPMLK